MLWILLSFFTLWILHFIFCNNLVSCVIGLVSCFSWFGRVQQAFLLFRFVMVYFNIAGAKMLTIGSF